MTRIRVLSALKIKQNLKPGMYADGLGLYLKVRPGNSKSWIFRYRIKGKLRDMGFGPFHTVPLAEARDKAEACRVMRLKGLDPLEERFKEQQARAIEAFATITFQKCAETYIATHRDGCPSTRTCNWRFPFFNSHWSSEFIVGNRRVMQL